MNRPALVAGCVLLPLCLFLARAAPGKTIYVDDDATGVNTGSSWADAYRYLQDALADANDSEKPVEIRVAQGTYKPDQGADVKARDYKATFRLLNGVTLKGGFVGCRAPDPNARDVERYASTLSGDLGGDDPDVNDPRDLLTSSIGPNSDVIVTGSGTDSTATLDGFTITAGYHYLDPIRDSWDWDRLPPPAEGWGAGMNNRTGSPTVIACTFLGNATTFSGAGMCNAEGSHPTVTDCKFVGNYAVRGGALANWNDCGPILTRCIFSENVAGYQGGAVYNHRSRSTFRDCTLARNMLESVHFSEGGAGYDEESTGTWTDCVFIENAASLGGALYSRDDNSLSLLRCTFIGNSAGTGGAIYGADRGDSFVMTASTLRENSANGSAGAMYLWGFARIADCRFSGNCCRGSGGAAVVRTAAFTNCLFTGNRAFEPVRGQHSIRVPTQGGAVHTGGSIEPLFFINCTFVANRAAWGSAVSTDKFTEFRSCILRGRAPLIWADPYEPQPQVAYSDIKGGWLGEWNIEADPCFAHPGYWADPDDPNRPGDPNDPNAIWVDGDYHLKSQAGRWEPNTQSWVKDDVTSPCVDAGDPNSPVGDEPEPNGGRINMGAYGGTAKASKSL